MTFQDLIRLGYLVKATPEEGFRRLSNPEADPSENVTDEALLNHEGFIHYKVARDYVLKLADGDLVNEGSRGFINLVTRIRPYVYWDNDEQCLNEPDCWFFEVEGEEDAHSLSLEHPIEVEVFTRVLVRFSFTEE